jgi:hypothetical protein
VLEFDALSNPPILRRSDVFVVPSVLQDDVKLDWREIPKPEFDICNAVCSFVFYQPDGVVPKNCFAFVAHNPNGLDLFRIAVDDVATHIDISNKLLNRIRGKVLDEWGWIDGAT